MNIFFIKCMRFYVLDKSSDKCVFIVLNYEKMSRTLCEPMSVEATSANNCVPLKISLQSCGKASNFDKRTIVSITQVIFSKKLYTNYTSNTYIIDP